VLNLKQKKLAYGLPHLDYVLPSCEACQYGKHTRLLFKQATWRATEKLRLIHTDLAGPQRIPSLKESKYYTSLFMISLECAGFTFSSLNQKLQVSFGDSSNGLKSKVVALLSSRVL